MTLEDAPLPKMPARASSVDNAWIWSVVLGPLAFVVLLIAANVVGEVTLPKSGNEADTIDPYVVWVSTTAIALALGGVAIAGLGLVFAYRDWLHLRRLSIERPFGWAWQFFAVVGVPAYAIGRAVVVRRRTGGGLAPLAVSLVVTGFTAIFVMVWAVFNAVPLLFLLALVLVGP